MSFIYGHDENAMPRYAPVHRIRTRAPFPRASSPDETTRLVRTPRWRILVLNERPAGGCAAARAGRYADASRDANDRSNSRDALDSEARGRARGPHASLVCSNARKAFS